MRLDDDSYIYSDINYDLFAYMKMHGMRYALRQPVMELNSGKGLTDSSKLDVPCSPEICYISRIL